MNATPSTNGDFFSVEIRPAIASRRQEVKKWKLIAVTALVGAGASPVLAQGIAHTFFMRGSIVAADRDGTIVCIGRADGAKVGQTLDVYQVTTNPGPSKGVFRRELVGHVTVEQVFDDHFASVRVADGRAALNDIVELTSK